jgi:hypothetical protein
MKKLALVSLAVLLAIAGVSARQSPTPDATRALVKSYLDIQGHLAADRFEDVKAPARTLAAQAAALGKPGEAIAKAGTAMVSAADITAARDAFGPLSDAMIAHVQASGSKDVAAELRIAYCPMNKRSWLQREEQVRNPYFGAKMLTCGQLKPAKP